jgi:hypothetical protein
LGGLWAEGIGSGWCRGKWWHEMVPNLGLGGLKRAWVTGSAEEFVPAFGGFVPRFARFVSAHAPFGPFGFVWLVGERGGCSIGRGHATF